MRVIKKKFKTLDKNGDGGLNFDELSKILQDANPDMTQREVALLFTKLDRNGNKKVDFDEFVDYVYEGHREGKSTGLEGIKTGVRPPGKGGGEGGGGGGGRRESEWDNLAEGERIDWVGLEKTFIAFAGRNGLLEGSEFMKMIRQAGLFDENFGPADVDTIFAAVALGERGLNMERFRDTIHEISCKKGWPGVAVRAKLAEIEPAIVGVTKCEAVSLYDKPRARVERRTPDKEKAGGSEAAEASLVTPSPEAAVMEAEASALTECNSSSDVRHQEVDLPNPEVSAA